MKQLTVRGFDVELQKRLRKLAREEGISLNQAALKLLRKGAGLSASSSAEAGIGSELDRFFGTWSDREADEFLRAVQVFERIDEELWK